MTKTRPLRRMTLHFSQILLTEGRTFIALSFRMPDSRTSYLHTQPQVFVFARNAVLIPRGRLPNVLTCSPTCIGT